MRYRQYIKSIVLVAYIVAFGEATFDTGVGFQLSIISPSPLCSEM